MSDVELNEEYIRESEIEDVFDYYDEPVLYSCFINDNRYLVLLIEETNVYQIWFYIQMANEQFVQLKSNVIDLYSAYKCAKEPYIHKVMIDKNDNYTVSKLSIADISDENLPDKNVYLRD